MIDRNDTKIQEVAPTTVEELPEELKCLSPDEKRELLLQLKENFGPQRKLNETQR